MLRGTALFRLIRRLSAVFFLFIIILGIAVHVESRLARREAEQMLRDLDTLLVNHDDVEDALSFLQRYGGNREHKWVTRQEGDRLVEDSHLTFSVYILPEWKFDLFNEVTVRPLLALGVSAWEVVVTVEITNGKVTRMSRWIWCLRPDAEMIGATASLEENSRPDEALMPYQVQFASNRSSDLHIRTMVSFQASPEHKKRAFDARLSCLTSFFGCRKTRGLVPAAWDDLEKACRRR